MTIHEEIKTAIESVVPVCVPDIYRGEATEYCTFNYSKIPDAFGDDVPDLIRYLVQLHYYCPEGQDSLNTRQALWEAILAADFTAPEEENASDETGQHYVFEFEALGGA